MDDLHQKHRLRSLACGQMHCPTNLEPEGPNLFGQVAAQAFVAYRNRGGLKTSPLPDFYIYAHAQSEDLTLLTRDGKGVDEVASLLGDPTKAKEKLGWVPEITLDEMVQEMVAADLADLGNDVLCLDIDAKKIELLNREV